VFEKLNGEHVSLPRNKVLANLFFRAGYVEAWGRGTLIMGVSCADAGLPKPIFREEFGGFAVEFNSTPLVTPLALNQTGTISQKLLAIMLENNRISMKEMADRLGITRDTVKEYIAKLKYAGLVKRIGRTSSGYWEVKESE
jgi:ATP-dependent DNA helicase RecG